MPDTDPSSPDSTAPFDRDDASPDSFVLDDEYRIRLSVFEGPVDLLLYLIRKKELDIHEISIADIAREYLEYVELIRLIDIEKAGDFLVVAATLMKLKSRSLFARPGEDDEDADEDPGRTLIRYLMEYERLGSVAEKLGEKEEERRSIFPRGGEKYRIERFIEEREQAPDYMLFDLLSALRDIMKSAPPVSSHEVEMINVTSEMKQKELLARLKKQDALDFAEFVAGQPRIAIVVTFLALLELLKSRRVAVRQSGQFSRIVITRRDDDERKDH